MIEETPLDIIPLGGLGEFGMNLTAYRYDGQILVVDCGLAFPTAETPGVDILIPDTQFLTENRDQVLGFLLTHGHEDHIGAMPYVWPNVEGPIYGTPMTLGLLEGKFREHDLLDKARFIPVGYRQPFQLGPFTIEYLHVTHSIVDAASLVISTPLGRVIHTADFNFDHTPVDGPPSDLFSLARYGEEGVLALLSDSTNVTVPGSTVTEREIAPVFDKIFATAKQLLIVATFSSNIQRIQLAIRAAVRAGRKIVLNGRSMVTNIRVARALGHITVPADSIIETKDIA
ncbi:MAG: ribonuclease J, partial [Magnetococcales bacterium]|nr:ribonuclease J [Magnetococcales bacterium]